MVCPVPLSGLASADDITVVLSELLLCPLCSRRVVGLGGLAGVTFELFVCFGKITSSMVLSSIRRHDMSAWLSL